MDDSLGGGWGGPTSLPAAYVILTLLPLSEWASYSARTQLPAETTLQTGIRHLATGRVSCRPSGPPGEGHPAHTGMSLWTLAVKPPSVVSEATCSAAVAHLPVSPYLYDNKLR